jgi:hypothetical protein
MTRLIKLTITIFVAHFVAGVSFDESAPRIERLKLRFSRSRRRYFYRVKFQSNAQQLTDPDVGLLRIGQDLSSYTNCFAAILFFG